MKTIEAGLKIFQSVQGYFIADRRTLNYVHLNRNLWDRASVVSKFGALSLNGHIPDTRFNDVLARFLLDDVKEGIATHNLEIFNTLCENLAFLNKARFVVSSVLCVHDPRFFPVWDDRRCLIQEWEKQNEVCTYRELKQRIDLYKAENGCNGLDYFMFNKLLWLCE